jgi:hypothetical protein
MVFSLYDWIAGGFSDWTLRVKLYTAYNGPTPPPWDLPGFVEPTYFGYGPFRVVQPTGYTQSSDGSRYVECFPGQFCVSLGNTVDDSVAGCYLTASGGSPMTEFLLNVQPFGQPFRMWLAGDTVPVRPLLYANSLVV